MIRNNWIKLLLAAGVILLWLLIVLSFENGSKEQPWRKKEVDMRIAIPSELLDGKVLSIGDSYEKVDKIEHLVPFEAHDPILGKTYSNGVYRGEGFKYIDEASFNINNELLTIGISVNNPDSLHLTQLFVNTVNILKGYYGDGYQIYGRVDNGIVITTIKWKLSNKTSVVLRGEDLVYDNPKRNSMIVRYNQYSDDSDTVGRTKIYNLLGSR